MLEFLILAGSLGLLLLAAEALILGAVALAGRARVSALVIGSTVVACGTSMPELAVMVGSMLTGQTTLGVGTLVGSNITNVLLVVGVPSLIAGGTRTSESFLPHAAALLGISTVLWFLSWDGSVGTVDGAILLGFFGFFAVYLAVSLQQVRKASHRHEQRPAVAEISGLRALALVLGGIAGLWAGSYAVVPAAVVIAAELGVPDKAVGIVFLAIGASLPELVTATLAAIHRTGGIAVGTVVGSNLFNIGGILGGSALFDSVTVEGEVAEFDLPVLVATSVVLMWIAARKGLPSAPAGACLVGAYLIYAWMQR